MECEATKSEVSQLLDDSTVLHLQCDGWSNLRTESINNFVVTQLKPVFVDFLTTEAHRHTLEYLSVEIEEEVSPVQISHDNC